MVDSLCSAHLLDGPWTDVAGSWSLCLALSPGWSPQVHIAALLPGLPPAPSPAAPVWTSAPVHPLAVAADRPCHPHIAQLGVNSCKVGQGWSTRVTGSPALALGSLCTGQPAARAGLRCLPLTQGGLVPCPPNDTGCRLRVGSLAHMRAILLAPCLFSGRDPARLAALSSGRKSAGHPVLLFISSCHLWCCSGMPWLLGIVLGHALMGLPCPLPIFAAASQELRNRPAASSLAGLPGNECRADKPLQMPGG